MSYREGLLLIGGSYVNTWNIRLDINVREIYLLESALQHEKNNIGLETLLRKYEDAIEDLREDLPFEQFCYLLGYLEYFDP